MTQAQPATYAAWMSRSIDLQGHRGARGLFPENTLAGFRGALAIGVDTLELDVAVTADGVVVLTHDPWLNPDITRTADGTWLRSRGPAISSQRADELSRYDVGRIRPGSAYAALFPEQTPHDGARIPTLADVLQIDPGVRFNVELKAFPLQPGLAMDGAGMAEAVLAIARAAGAVERITVQSFDWRGPRRLRRAHPDVRVAWLTRADILQDARRWWDGPDPSDYGGSIPRAIAAEGGPVWGPDFHDLDEDALQEAHALGLIVVPWTVNQPEDMRRLLHWGIDGLITDRPDLARLILAEQAFRLPSPRGAEEMGRGRSTGE